MKKSITLLGLLALSTASFASSGGGTPNDEVQTAYKYEKIKVKTGVTLVDNNTYGVESVAVSNDGQRICWIGKFS